MNLEKLNQWLALLGNLGVLVGIVFLAIELRQNTNMMESQTRDSMTSKILDWNMTVAADLEMSKRWENGRRRGDMFDVGTGETGEFTSFMLLIQSNLLIWENEHYQYQKGLYTENEFTPRTTRWKSVIQSNPGYQLVWCGNSSAYSISFQELINSYLYEVASCEDVRGR